MFCPQCRLSWPSGVKNGGVNADKPRRQINNATQWGNPLVCPNCLVPLAADRIQGEFPSVAHAAQTIEGSMTVKDVLRETAAGQFVSGEIPLDDKKPSSKQGFFWLDANGKNLIGSFLNSSKPGPRMFIRLAIIGLSMLIGSIVFLSLQATGNKRFHMVDSGVLPKNAHSAQMTPDQEALVALMPYKVGNWSREEANEDLWNDHGVGNADVETYMATYRSGDDRVQEWVVKAPSIQSGSQLQNFEGTTRAVHTDSGVVYVTPQTYDVGGKTYIAFDFVPNSNDEQDWVVANQSFSPTMMHTMSWYQSPYVITVGANDKVDRDDFVRQVMQTIR